MNERAWYQDGWVVLGILAVVTVLGPMAYTAWQQSQKTQLRPQMAGRIDQPMFGDPSLEIYLWHQHSGNLRNGFLVVSITSDMVKNGEGKDAKVHSFEVWEPNRENAVTFQFPLRNYDSSQEIRVTIMMGGKKYWTYLATDTWVGDGWKPAERAAQ